ncbi:MAG: bile acid:sodium symporter family protein [Cyclobacteriaceae bacterium]
MEEVDSIVLNLGQENVLLLNISLGLIMFGVALDLKIENFREIIRNPKAPLIGVFSQFIVLPFLTFLLVLLFKPGPSLALGMILVSACPGGNISNFMSSFSGGNAALSVSLTAISTALAIIMTPFNLSFWGGMYAPTAAILEIVELNPLDVFKTVTTILGIPIVLGMTIRHLKENFALRILPYLQKISILIFAAFVVTAFYANFDLFVSYIHVVVGIVFVHNAVALITGYQIASLFGLQEADKRALSIETGIQNSTLGLVLVLDFFNGLGGMAIVAAWWGIWHIISGLTMAFYWNRKKFVVEA